ncbi:ester cyclase [Serratia sp. Tan611]|uniref:ester cyclase n=1 Tax=Serratia sp. Tan611 TaxID=2773264 RepID=UPI001932294C|nr:ester cyclase [Serratia sp. Tan611]CAE1146229.1 Predicted ester cyclase [Serratia sp. Tan611]
MTDTDDLTQRLQTERAAVETLYRAFNDKDPELVHLAVTRDWQDIPLAPGQGPGPDGFKPLLAGFIAAFPDIRITIHEMLQEPGKAAVRAEITGTHLGEFMGMAPSGRSISVRLHEFHTLNGERVTATWHMEDWLALYQQLGHVPPL